MSYTITEMIDSLDSGVSRYHSANIEWSDDRSYFDGWLECYGESVDLGDGSEDNWCEEEMRYFECSPFLSEDNHVEEGDFNGEPVRTHDYSSCYIYIRVNLPENRKRGSRYTEDQIQQMVEILSYGNDEPGHGFEFFNMPDEVDEEN